MTTQPRTQLCADGQTVEEWRCQRCHRLLLLHYLALRDGEVILEVKCRGCKTLNNLTRLAGSSLPTNGQGRLGLSSLRAVEPERATQGGPHAESPTRQR